MAYNATEAASIDILREHIMAFRRWMADHGERGKPLIISGFGVRAAPVALGQGNAQAGKAMVLGYMISAFDYFRAARSDVLGYPADDNRLVQRWLWHGLYDAEYDATADAGYTGVLFSPPSAESQSTQTAFGQTFIAYMESVD